MSREILSDAKSFARYWANNSVEQYRNGGREKISHPTAKAVLFRSYRECYARNGLIILAELSPQEREGFPYAREDDDEPGWVFVVAVGIDDAGSAHFAVEGANVLGRDGSPCRIRSRSFAGHWAMETLQERMAGNLRMTHSLRGSA